MKSLLVFLCAFAITVVGHAAEDPAYTAAMREIKTTFGMVPTFFKEYPAAGLAGAWSEFKAVQLNPKSALDAKTKELIGLAVASQIPCRYCAYFHKKGIKANGGTKEEMNMAIALAADVRKWSTYFNGSQLDMAQFKSDVDKMKANAEKNKDKEMVPMTITDAFSAMKDIETHFGFVPAFIKSYPEAALPGAWSNIRGVLLSPAVLPPKNKSLINVAVSAQIPCNYCSYIDTEMAKLNGATTAEIQEAVAMAGMVRHWSTVLNGLMQDEKAFQKEVDGIFMHLQKRMGPVKTKVGSL